MQANVRMKKYVYSSRTFNSYCSGKKKTERKKTKIYIYIYISIRKIYFNLIFTFTLLVNQAATSIADRTSTVPGVFVKCTSTQRVERVCAPHTLTRATIFSVSQSA